MRNPIKDGIREFLEGCVGVVFMCIGLALLVYYDCVPSTQRKIAVAIGLASCLIGALMAAMLGLS